ncbi:MAG: hypothetical protein B6D46_04250 [Polyangiaceae bacterium UTPRO1]|nr:MAG: hypothetical protein B6D46_04250 [Polyangiaceae bacterium UTPRO1]
MFAAFVKRDQSSSDVFKVGLKVSAKCQGEDGQIRSPRHNTRRQPIETLFEFLVAAFLLLDCSRTNLPCVRDQAIDPFEVNALQSLLEIAPRRRLCLNQHDLQHRVSDRFAKTGFGPFSRNLARGVLHAR